MAKKKSSNLSLADIKKELNTIRPDSVYNATDNVDKLAKFIPTGVLALDEILGGGFAKGRIVDLYGPEGSGKCLVAGTLIATEFGQIPIEKFIELIDPSTPPLSEHPLEVPLVNMHGEIETSVAFTMNGTKPVIRVVTETGREIISTHNHPHLVVRDSGIQWIETSNLQVGDLVIRGEFKAPEESMYPITPDQSYILGVLSAGVTAELTTSKTEPIIKAKHPTEVYDTVLLPYGGNFVEFMRSAFTSNSRMESYRSFMDQTGFIPAPDEMIEAPLSVLAGNATIIEHYLSGLLEAIGTLEYGKMHVSVMSRRLANQIKILFESIGIRVTLSEVQIAPPLETIGFRIEATGHAYLKFMDIFFPGVQHTTATPPPEVGELIEFEGYEFNSTRFEAITTIEELEGERETYDFSMPTTHSFVANGMITHNTALALKFAANAQKEGTVFFFNAENSYDPNLAESAGCDLDTLEVADIDVAETVFETIRKLIKTGEVSAIIVDSFAGLVTEAELAGEIGDAHVAKLGRIASDGFKILTSETMSEGSDVIIVCVNQLRSNIGAMGNAPKTTVTGGRALKFYASTRINVARTGQITRSGEVVGHTVKFKTDKSKLSPPFQTVEVDLNYDGGYSNEGTLLDLLLEYGILTKSGNWHVDTRTGEKFGNGREAAKGHLREYPDYYDSLYESLMELRYGSNDEADPLEDPQDD